MTDIDAQVRELLRSKADGLPPHLEFPPALEARARRRIARNAVGAGIAAVVVAVVVLTGARAFSGPSVGPVPGESLTGPTPSSSPAGPPACTSAELRATGSMEGAAGSRDGAITVSNLSAESCTLRGLPTVTLLDETLNPSMRGVDPTPGPPGWRVDGSSKPSGWPVVTLGPGDAASIRIGWSNWCPDGRSSPSWRVGIPGGAGSLAVAGLEAVPPPPCNGPTLPSTIVVGPFEPAAHP